MDKQKLERNIMEIIPVVIIIILWWVLMVDIREIKDNVNEIKRKMESENSSNCPNQPEYYTIKYDLKCITDSNVPDGDISAWTVMSTTTMPGSAETERNNNE